MARGPHLPLMPQVSRLKTHKYSLFSLLSFLLPFQVTITEANGNQSTYRATLRGFDADKDVAVLKINTDTKKLKPLPLGSSQNVKASSIFPTFLSLK